MTTIRERILDCLTEHPEGADDGELTSALGLKHHAQANDRCRQLAAEGLIDRREVNGRLRNFSAGAPPPAALPQADPASLPDADRPWYWEGNVQAALARFLCEQGCEIVSTADTARRARGKDIVAERGGRPLWVTVKGYPVGTAKTRASTMASHWFKRTLFDVVAWRGEDPDAEVAVALPDFKRYRDLAPLVAWAHPVLRFSFYWVQKDGSVLVVPAPPGDACGQEAGDG